ADQMLRLVVLADVGDDFLRGRQLPVQRLVPRPAERAGIIEDDPNLEVADIGAPDPLGDVQHLAVRIDANPALVVVADGVNDERVAVPLADRVSNPARIGIGRVRTAVEEDLPEPAAVFEEHDEQRGRLDGLRHERPDRRGRRQPLREASRMGRILERIAAALQERLGNALKDAPHTRCLPQGLPTPASIGPFMAKTVQTPSLLVVLFEDSGGFRQIFLDGRPHPPDPDPSWVGHSIGKWDGDTLVVDTIGYNDKSWIGIYPHSEMLHVTERIRRPDVGHLEIRVVFDDPGAFSRPWNQTLNWELAPAEEVVAYVCENNKAEHLVGK